MPPQIGRLVGGPGTGKTTALLEMLTGAKEKLGGDYASVGMASFTRAARETAVERASLAWGVPVAELNANGWFRTVHSAVFRLLRLSPEQLVRMESKKDLEWLSEVMGVSVSVTVDEDTGRISYGGDKHVSFALNCWELARVTLQPLEKVALRAVTEAFDALPVPDIVRICRKYETAKRLEERFDYCDTLLRFSGISATTDGFGTVAPEGELPGVQAWLFDEQQDASPLLDAVCKRLVNSPQVKWAYVVGDPFQSIFGFAGSSASCFMGWPADKERTMPKSYRCPRQILELGERCLRRMREGYFDRRIAPADHAGSVEEVTAIDEAVSMAGGDEEWLFIARTNAQANRFMAALSAANLPFRSTKAPAGPTARVQGLAALWSLQHGKPISGDAWGHVLDVVASRRKDGTRLIQHGAKAAWKQPGIAERWDCILPTEISEVGATEALSRMVRAGEWPDLCDYGPEFARTARRWGIDRATEPKIRVGTIHSVKGAESDNVALLTTTNARIRDGVASGSQHDEECRVTYVGVTRARRRLVVINEGRWRDSRMEVL